MPNETVSGTGYLQKLLLLTCSQHRRVLTAFAGLILTSIMMARVKLIAMVSSRLPRKPWPAASSLRGMFSIFPVMTPQLRAFCVARIIWQVSLRSLPTPRLDCDAFFSWPVFKPPYALINLICAGLSMRASSDFLSTTPSP